MREALWVSPAGVVMFRCIRDFRGHRGRRWCGSGCRLDALMLPTCDVAVFPVALALQ